MADGAAPVNGRVFVAGGTGFVGSNLQKALADRPVRLLVRDKAKYANLANDRVELVEGDVTRPETLRGTMDGCEAVIDLVAIINEEGSQTFDKVIRQGGINVIEEAKRAGVKRLLQMSAMGTRNDPAFPYFNAKYAREEATKASGIPYSIYRPSVIFGPGDEFINTLADLVRKAPVIPVVGDGQSKFQPVYVKDVADSFERGLADPSTAGKTFELGGPDILAYEQMLQIIANELGMGNKKMVHVPVGMMKMVVAMSGPLPKAIKPPVTSEQLKMLAINNSTDNNATPDLIEREPLALKGGISYIRK